MRYSKTDQAEAVKQLREWLKPGDTVYTVLDHVSRSGMSRNIRIVLMKMDEHGEPYTLHPNHSVACVLGAARAKRGDGMVVTGCGMDMGFHIVNSLSYALFPDGFDCIGKGNGHGTSCPAADHNNGDRNYEPHRHEKHQGAYALRHRWL